MCKCESVCVLSSFVLMNTGTHGGQNSVLSPGTRVTGVCETLNAGTGNRTQVFWESSDGPRQQVPTNSHHVTGLTGEVFFLKRNAASGRESKEDRW